MKLIRSIAAGILYRVQQYLTEIGHDEFFHAAPELEEVIDSLDLEALDLLEKEEAHDGSAYHRLIELMGGTPAGQTLLDLTCAVMLYPKFGTLLETWHGHMVTPELACFIENETYPSYDMLNLLYKNASLILYSSGKAEPFYYENFFADNRLLGYLSESKQIDNRLEHTASIFRSEEHDNSFVPLMIRAELRQELLSMLSGSDDIWIKGDKGSGKKHLLKHALRDCGKQMLFVDAEALFNSHESVEKLVWLIRREALLTKCDVCLHGISQALLQKLQISLEQLFQQAAEPFCREGIRIVFCTTSDVELLSHLNRPLRILELPALTREERIHLWEQYLNYFDLSLDAMQIGSKYKFTPAEINKAVRQLRAEFDAGNELSDFRVQNTLIRVLPPIATKGRIEPPHKNCTMDSLILPPQEELIINQICNHVKYSHQVFDNWNMESRFAYGKAISVLLCGPPGTGKTMTARVLSDRLGLPLYHVNLSQLVDKYIGETEKHLEEIFSNAEKSNIILFFDEADSVFSKRSQVSDSQDKYANTEVSFILQRLEAYDGMVILSTNFLNNIDHAFLRRIQYIVNFNMPGTEERKKLWENAIPAECPTERIDFEYLSQQFELSGSSIKSAVLTATFYAAGHHEVLGMKHLIFGVKNEFIKTGKPVFAASFGEYAYLYY